MAAVAGSITERTKLSPIVAKRTWKERLIAIAVKAQSEFYSGQIALPQPPSKPITDQRTLRPQPRCRALLAFAFGDHS